MSSASHTPAPVAMAGPSYTGGTVAHYKAESLDGMLRQREEEYGILQSKYFQLREDFQFNVKLVEDRDVELAKYESTLNSLKAAVGARDAQLIELKTSLASAEKGLASDREREGSMQTEMIQLRQQLDAARYHREDDLRHAKETWENERREMQRELQLAVREAEAQRADLVATYDGMLRQREAEHSAHSQEISSRMTGSEGHIRDLERAAEKSADDALRARTDSAEAARRMADAETRCRAAEEEAAEVRRRYAAEGEDAARKHRATEQSLKRMVAELESQCAEMVKNMRAMDEAMEALKRKHSDEVNDLKERQRHEVAAEVAKYGGSTTREWEEKLAVFKREAEARDLEAQRAHSDQLSRLREECARKVEEVKAGDAGEMLEAQKAASRRDEMRGEELAAVRAEMARREKEWQQLAESRTAAAEEERDRARAECEERERACREDAAAQVRAAQEAAEAAERTVREAAREQAALAAELHASREEALREESKAAAARARDEAEARLAEAQRDADGKVEVAQRAADEQRAVAVAEAKSFQETITQTREAFEVQLQTTEARVGVAVEERRDAEQRLLDCEMRAETLEQRSARAEREAADAAAARELAEAECDAERHEGRRLRMEIDGLRREAEQRGIHLPPPPVGEPPMWYSGGGATAGGGEGEAAGGHAGGGEMSAAWETPMPGTAGSGAGGVAGYTPGPTGAVQGLFGRSSPPSGATGVALASAPQDWRVLQEAVERHRLVEEELEAQLASCKEEGAAEHRERHRAESRLHALEAEAIDLRRRVAAGPAVARLAHAYVRAADKGAVVVPGAGEVAGSAELHVAVKAAVRRAFFILEGGPEATGADVAPGDIEVIEAEARRLRSLTRDAAMAGGKHSPGWGEMGGADSVDGGDFVKGDAARGALRNAHRSEALRASFKNSVHEVQLGQLRKKQTELAADLARAVDKADKERCEKERAMSEAAAARARAKTIPMELERLEELERKVTSLAETGRAVDEDDDAMAVLERRVRELRFRGVSPGPEETRLLRLERRVEDINSRPNSRAPSRAASVASGHFFPHQHYNGNPNNAQQPKSPVSVPLRQISTTSTPAFSPGLRSIMRTTSGISDVPGMSLDGGESPYAAQGSIPGSAGRPPRAPFARPGWSGETEEIDYLRSRLSEAREMLAGATPYGVRSPRTKLVTKSPKSKGKSKRSASAPPRPGPSTGSASSLRGTTKREQLQADRRRMGARAGIPPSPARSKASSTRKRKV